MWFCTLASAGIAKAWRVLAYRTAFVILGLVAIRALEIADYSTQAFAPSGWTTARHSMLDVVATIVVAGSLIGMLAPWFWKRGRLPRAEIAVGPGRKKAIAPKPLI